LAHFLQNFLIATFCLQRILQASFEFPKELNSQSIALIQNSAPTTFGCDSEAQKARCLRRFRLNSPINSAQNDSRERRAEARRQAGKQAARAEGDSANCVAHKLLNDKRWAGAAPEFNCERRKSDSGARATWRMKNENWRRQSRRPRTTFAHLLCKNLARPKKRFRHCAAATPTLLFSRRHLVWNIQHLGSGGTTS
jgi:hypothetical protein